MRTEIAAWPNHWPELPPACRPDASNPKAVALARSIVTQNTPTHWSARGEWAQAIDGVAYLFVMWSSRPGVRDVSIYNCGPLRQAMQQSHRPRPAGNNMGTPYSANMEAPCPPCEGGWRVVNDQLSEAYDLVFKARAEELLSELPLWSCYDEQLGSGLYRWFAYEHACGRAIGCMKHVGTMGADTVPQEQDPGTVDPINPDNPKSPGGEPIPQPDATCGAWSPTVEGNISDESTPTGLANAISYHNRPVAWKDQTFYRKTIGGTPWTFVMYSSGGKRMVSTFKCTNVKKTEPPPALTISSSALWIVLALLAVVGGGAALAYSNEKKHKKAA